MKKILQITAILVFSSLVANAQDSSSDKKNSDRPKIEQENNLRKRDDYRKDNRDERREYREERREELRSDRRDDRFDERRPRPGRSDERGENGDNRREERSKEDRISGDYDREPPHRGPRGDHMDDRQDGRQDRPGKGERGEGSMGSPDGRKKLSPEQQTKLRQEMERHRQEMKSIMGE